MPRQHSCRVMDKIMTWFNHWKQLYAKRIFTRFRYELISRLWNGLLTLEYYLAGPLMINVENIAMIACLFNSFSIRVLGIRSTKGNMHVRLKIGIISETRTIWVLFYYTFKCIFLNEVCCISHLKYNGFELVPESPIDNMSINQSINMVRVWRNTHVVNVSVTISYHMMASSDGNIFRVFVGAKSSSEPMLIYCLLAP